jgi:hypothetical protein
VDPVTGLSRRQQLALVLLIPIGIVASTAATVISERATSACPDTLAGCAVLREEEPVLIALVDASERGTTWPLEDVAAPVEPGARSGRPARIDLFRPGCSVEAASEAVREIASDPPDEPPTVVVLAAACDAAAVPIAQVLSDDGVPVVFLNELPAVPTDPPFTLLAAQPDLEAQATGVQGIGLASHLRALLVAHIDDVLGRTLAALERVTVRDGENVLIPRRPLRDALIDEGFSPD